MHLTPRARAAFLLIDGLALAGTIVFSVLSALERETMGYVVGQIVSAGSLLVSVVVQHWLRDRRAAPDDEPLHANPPHADALHTNSSHAASPHDDSPDV